jgi:hypothetical protein
MKIKLHIDRLILDGLPLERRHRPHVQAAVEEELTRLLAAHGLGREWQSGGTVPRIRAPSFQLANANPPSRLGQQIAGSIYGSIGERR